MRSEISICNQAISFCGASPIISFMDGTKEAILCEANFKPVRDAVLEDADWSFALRRKKLAQIPDDTLGYNQFQLPDDCLRVIQCSPDQSYDHTSDMYWELESDVVITNNGTVYARYVAQETDTAKYTSAFDQALAYRLASDLAIPLTKNTGLQKQLYQIYEERMRVARGNDGKQGRSRKIRSTWSSKSRRSGTRVAL